MKFTKIIIVTIVFCLFLTSCNAVDSGQTDYFGFKTSVFTVVDDCKITMSHPLNRETYIITYLVHGYGLEKDWCVFGIRPMKEQAEEGE